MLNGLVKLNHDGLRDNTLSFEGKLIIFGFPPCEYLVTDLILLL